MALSLQTVHVDLGERSYDIEIGSGNLANFDGLLEQCDNASHAVLITDENVDSLYGDRVADALTAADFEVDIMVVNPGEQSKSTDMAAELWETMLEEGTDRKSLVIALGGGVVGDLAGFMAATFARGLRFIQIPTTLLAQVDSSVGGKVGVNLPRAKNMVGAFWQPLAVLVDVDTLQSLPDREYRAGLAEVVKYGVILDVEFFGFLEQHVDAIAAREPATLQQIVQRCCRLKANVVEKDEREETGLRAVLNYGHTFCHALEAATGYGELLHGEGVSIGMMCASRLAQRLGRVDADFSERQFNLLSKLGLPTTVPESDHDELLQLMVHDKKTANGQLRFVLPTRMGHVELVGDVSDADVLAAMQESA